MESIAAHSDCPCGSGLTYAVCCGAAETDVPASRGRVTAGGAIEVGQLTPSVVASLDAMDSVPDIFPVRIDFAAASARLVKMSPRWYRDSVFLDSARIIGKYALDMDLPRFAAIADATQWRPTPMIFHTAFCGSTLMSQALAGAFDSVPLREPDILGNVMFYGRSADVSDEERVVWLGRAMRLLSRRYSETQSAVVKANDYANELMLPVLRWQADVPILFMYTPLDEFVAACLKAENRRPWLRDRFRMVRDAAAQRFNDGARFDLGVQLYAEMAAVYWAYNLALYLDAFEFAPTRVRCLDFNRMLRAPTTMVAACGKFFDLAPLPGVDRDAVVAELFGVYSKNTEFKYSPQQREQDVAKLRARFAREIDAAEIFARGLLGIEYPEPGLPGALNAR